MEPKTSSVHHEWDQTQSVPQQYSQVQLPMLPRDQVGAMGENTLLGSKMSTFGLGSTIGGFNGPRLSSFVSDWRSMDCDYIVLIRPT